MSQIEGTLFFMLTRKVFKLKIPKKQILIMVAKKYFVLGVSYEVRPWEEVSDEHKLSMTLKLIQANFISMLKPSLKPMMT